jgi:inositol oxygenase
LTLYSLPNLIHMLQTAEGIRKAGHPDWMQLVGLIHDMGKIMFLWGTPEDGQIGKQSCYCEVLFGILFMSK